MLNSTSTKRDALAAFVMAACTVMPHPLADSQCPELETVSFSSSATILLYKASFALAPDQTCEINCYNV